MKEFGAVLLRIFQPALNIAVVGVLALQRNAPPTTQSIFVRR
jgi:hypothetical protein